VRVGGGKRGLAALRPGKSRESEIERVAPQVGVMSDFNSFGIRRGKRGKKKNPA